MTISFWVTSVPPTLYISAGIAFIPGALPDDSCLIALIVSSTMGRLSNVRQTCICGSLSARPHFFKDDLKRLTPVHRRFSKVLCWCGRFSCLTPSDISHVCFQDAANQEARKHDEKSEQSQADVLCSGR